MKTIAKFLAMSLFPAVFMFTSCSKDRLIDETNPDKTNNYTSLDDFYDLNEPEEQEFVIDSIGGDTIVAQEGTKIFDVPKEIFMRKSDHTDITYPYTIKLIEAYGMKNKILSKLLGVAQGSMLYSGGNLRFRAFKDADELELKEHCGLPFMSPTQAPVSSMELFYGFTTGTTDDWNNDVLQAGYLFSVDDVTFVNTNSYGYHCKTAKMGWVNIAEKSTATAQSTVTFTADGTNTNFIDVYIIFNNLGSHIKVHNLQAVNLPDGEPITVFAIGKDASQQMFYFKESYTTGVPLLIELEMVPATESQILTIMDSL
jgi:hypothetical protein